jgi:hypothetical protein
MTYTKRLVSNTRYFKCFILVVSIQLLNYGTISWVCQNYALCSTVWWKDKFILIEKADVEYRGVQKAVFF